MSFAIALTLLVAAIHFYIVYLEMALWDTERGRKAFGTTPEFSAQSKVLAANQGLYNGFLAVGLILAVLLGNIQMQYFLLACVLTAGLYGAMTVGRKTLFAQALPAAAALLAVRLKI